MVFSKKAFFAAAIVTFAGIAGVQAKPKMKTCGAVIADMKSSFSKSGIKEKYGKPDDTAGSTTWYYNNICINEDTGKKATLHIMFDLHLIEPL